MFTYNSSLGTWAARRLWPILAYVAVPGCGASNPHLSDLGPRRDAGASDLPAHPDIVDAPFGEHVHDPYRWLESSSGEALDWVHKQGEQTRQVLASLPRAKDIRERLLVIFRGTDTISDLHVTSNRLFYLRQSAGEEIPRLCVRVLGGPERVLFRSSPGSPPFVITQVSPSDEGRYVAVTVSSRGSADSSVRVIDVDSGRELENRIEHVSYPTIAWLPGDNRFFYTRDPHILDPDSSLHYRDELVLRHTLSATSGDETVVFGTGAFGSPTLDPGDMVTIQTVPHGSHELAIVHHGASGNVSIYMRRASQDSVSATWRKVVTRDDAVTAWSLSGSHLYVISRRDNAFGVIIGIDLAPASTSRRIYSGVESRN